jgi:hypothetical protein
MTVFPCASEDFQMVIGKESSVASGRAASFASLAALLMLAAGTAHAQQVLITEFMASNSSTIADENGEYSDWVEIANLGASSINLDGWYITDSATNKTKWRIPAITLAPGEHRIIWTSDKNRANPNAPLHTNFKLSADGEYLGLIMPDGTTVSHEYAPTFPAQQTDVSYGLATDASVANFIQQGAAARAFIPTNNTLGTTWTARTYSVPGSWLSGVTGVGYETQSGYESHIGLNVRNQMYGANASCYIRVPFTLGSVPAFDALKLRMKYDDGFVAYLNGTKVASRNAPTTPTWNSISTQGHSDAEAVVFEDIDITAASSGLLVSGTNVVAIHGLNAAANNSDFLITPELVASVAGDYNPNSARYYTESTPGQPNSVSGADLGPFITDQAYGPTQPQDADAILVTATIAQNLNPVQTVTLYYRTNFGAESSTPMFDDGLHGDGGTGDGVYGGYIPPTASTPGQMSRWYIRATDSQGNGSRLPSFVSATQTPEYFGTMIAASGVNTQLPVVYWWVQNEAAAGTDTGTRCSLWYLGRFYDNVFVRLRGQSSAEWPKPHFKLDFNSGHYFTFREGVDAVEEINLQSTYSDKSYIRQALSWEVHEMAGSPGCESEMVRVQRNGAFYSVACFVEQPDEEYLTRNGLDNGGALYKMYNECIDPNWGVEKKTREHEDNSDLGALVSGVQLPTGPALTNYMFDNIDLPRTISYIAATTLIHDNDHLAKNYYIYRDTENSGEWMMLPWDKDLTFGRNYGAGGGVLSDGIWADDDPMSHPLFGDAAHPKIDGPYNRFIDAMHREPTIRRMYLRRLRTLMDELLQAPGTPTAQRVLENRINQLQALCASDVVLDRAKWGNPYGDNQDFVAALNILKNEYLNPRRVHLFQTHSVSNGGLIPGAQSAAPTLEFGVIERSPASGNKDEEYIEIYNPSTEAIDISGWTLDGDVTYTFKPGTVVVGQRTMYVSPHVVAFRARAQSPRGGEGLFVQGDFSGHLASPAEELRLLDADGRVVAFIAACPADFDESGFLDTDDFDAFVTAFELGEDAADFDKSGFVDTDDFDNFVRAFELGC